jgi:hypothetical protein
LTSPDVKEACHLVSQDESLLGNDVMYLFSVPEGAM